MDTQLEHKNLLTGGPALPCGPGGPLGPCSPYHMHISYSLYVQLCAKYQLTGVHVVVGPLS